MYFQPFAGLSSREVQKTYFLKTLKKENTVYPCCRKKCDERSFLVNTTYTGIYAKLESAGRMNKI